MAQELAQQLVLQMEQQSAQMTETQLALGTAPELGPLSG
jgi:hypothetical protein